MCSCVVCVGGIVLDVSYQDPRVCVALKRLIKAEPLVYLMIINKACVLLVVCVGGRALGVSGQDYPSMCADMCV